MKRIVAIFFVLFVCASVLSSYAQDWNKARDLFKRGKYLEAATEAKKVIESTNPDWAQGRLFLGLCYLKAKKYQEALVELDRTLQLDPKIASAYFYLGQVYAAQKKYSEALAQYEKAVKNVDTEKEKRILPLVYKEAGNAARQLRRWGKAVQYFKKATELNPKDHQAWFLLGYSYSKQNDFNRAIQALGKAYQLKPREKMYGIYYVKTLLIVKKYNEAKSVVENLLKLYPNESDVLKYAGDVYLGLKQFEKAATYYAQYLKLKPNDGWYIFNYAQALVKLKKWSEAEQQLKKAASILKNYRVYALLGYVYIKMKKYQDAKVQYKKAYDLSKKPQYFEELKKIDKRIEQEELKKKGLAEEVTSDGA